MRGEFIGFHETGVDGEADFCYVCVGTGMRTLVSYVNTHSDKE